LRVGIRSLGINYTPLNTVPGSPSLNPMHPMHASSIHGRGGLYCLQADLLCRAAASLINMVVSRTNSPSSSKPFIFCQGGIGAVPE
jgi:hypothetical protein